MTGFIHLQQHDFWPGTVSRDEVTGIKSLLYPETEESSQDFGAGDGGSKK
jgi:hypothetical protein